MISYREIIAELVDERVASDLWRKKIECWSLLIDHSREDYNRYNSASEKYWAQPQSHRAFHHKKRLLENIQLGATARHWDASHWESEQSREQFRLTLGATSAVGSLIKYFGKLNSEICLFSWDHGYLKPEQLDAHVENESGNIFAHFERTARWLDDIQLPMPKANTLFSLADNQEKPEGKPREYYHRETCHLKARVQTAYDVLKIDDGAKTRRPAAPSKPNLKSPQKGESMSAWVGRLGLGSYNPS